MGNQEPANNTEAVITPILTATYGDGSMPRALAAHLAELVDAWPAVDGSIYRTREETIMQVCWNWFPGGGTAQSAAREIEAALKPEPSDRESEPAQ